MSKSEKNKMKQLKRTLETTEVANTEILYFGYNSNGVFTICLEGNNLINLNPNEFRKLKEFIEKLK